jgi:myo-inositol 2-dehydrogenase/D-chiro-inositol 1-dehydrogenase
MPVRIGFVGAGGIAREHLKNLAEMPNAQIAAVCDTVAAAAQDVASLYHCQAYSSHEDMLSQEQLDAVYICVPPFTRGPAEIAAARRGVAMFVEKPVALDLETAREIQAAIERAGVLVNVGYVYRYLETVERAREALDGRPIGMVLGHYLTSTPKSPWWRVKAKSGGQLVEQTTHIVDTARYFAGDVATVAAAAGRRLVRDLEGMDIDDVTSVLLTFESGAIGQIASTCGSIPGYGTAGLTIIAEKVVVEILGTTGLRIRRPGRVEEIQKSNFSIFRAEDDAFVRAVETGDRSLVRSTFADAVKTLAVTLAVDESVAKGSIVHLT